MKQFLLILGCAAGAVGLMMLGLGVKMLVRKRGTFKRPCSSMDPYTGEQHGCVCGKASGRQCHPERHEPLEINKSLRDEL